MSVKLRKRKNNDGTTSLFLAIYHSDERKYTYEFLKDLKLVKVRTPADTALNKEREALAKQIALIKQTEIAANDYNVLSESAEKTDVVAWMQNYIDKYKKKDKRNLQGALNRFKAFLADEKKSGITFGKLKGSVHLIAEFQEYLREHSTGEGSASYFNRFKKMVKHAATRKLLPHNIAAEVKTVRGNPKRKDVLTLDEIQVLANTPTESAEVKKAFLFSCVTGLRWADVTALTWSKINYKEKYMVVGQSKTGEELYANLNATAMQLIGKEGEAEEPVFILPTANGANKTVKAWVKRAGIKKKITWHNARHSFGTNLIYFGADVTTASSLLGHTSLKHTQRYVKAASDLKQKAAETLNIELPV